MATKGRCRIAITNGGFKDAPTFRASSDPPRFRLVQGFLGRAENGFEKRDAVGVLVVAGQDELRLEG